MRLREAPGRRRGLSLCQNPGAELRSYVAAHPPTKNDDETYK
jgi:hypothetical protein